MRLDLLNDVLECWKCKFREWCEKASKNLTRRFYVSLSSEIFTNYTEQRDINVEIFRASKNTLLSSIHQSIWKRPKQLINPTYDTKPQNIVRRIPGSQRMIYKVKPLSDYIHTVLCTRKSNILNLDAREHMVSVFFFLIFFFWIDGFV